MPGPDYGSVLAATAGLSGGTSFVYNGWAYAGKPGQGWIRIPTESENVGTYQTGVPELFSTAWASGTFQLDDPANYDDTDALDLTDWIGALWDLPIRWRILFYPAHEWRYAQTNPYGNPIRCTDGTAEMILVPAAVSRY